METLIALCLNHLTARRRLRAARRELAALAQHELNDLGIGRSELPYLLAARGAAGGQGPVPGTIERSTPSRSTKWWYSAASACRPASQRMVSPSQP
ncbi:DUF1127 domain-containing protein [Ramlibacter humi]|uniref:DUF1127 domain-containing protein n=1 Tax=Ramlibacter humi TaxID=2530451 RepID=A0A4Z0C7R0_9BURK|nr:DUF1127 domain-containing protein [Ramlibacter humi]